MSKLLNPEEMTSRDYYFDSYAHFGIHEVTHPGWGPVGQVELCNFVLVFRGGRGGVPLNTDLLSILWVPLE